MNRQRQLPMAEKRNWKDEKANNLTEQADLNDDAPLEELFPITPDLRPHVTFGGDTNQEPPVILYTDEKSTQFDEDDLTNDRTSLTGEATSDIIVDMEPNFDNIEHLPLELSNNLELASDFSSSFMAEVEELDHKGENVFSPSYAGISIELPDSKTLEEKVTMFMKDGYLDPVDDNLSGIYEEIGKEEPDGLGSPEFTGSEKGQGVHPKTPAEVQPVHMYGSQDPVSSSTSNPCSSPAKFEYPLGDNHSSGEGPFDACMDKFVDSEMTEGENQAEMSQLRYKLHQKELELSRLNEEIKKEKLALSFLQMKAENEISKAQKLISEKDAELQAAEESLSGLKEVEIQYCGDGDIVEVAGSFNGWHHRIKMDPHPLGSTNGAGSRKSRLWSTMLWLYPGVYEIKFIVDGQWIVDPGKESTTKDSICNNILRVNR